MQRNFFKKIAITVAAIFTLSPISYLSAAPTPSKSSQKPKASVTSPIATSTALKQWRANSTPDKIRIVADFTNIPEFKTKMAGPGQIVIDLPNTEIKTLVKSLPIKDPAIASVEIKQLEGKKARITIQLDAVVKTQVFTLTKPNRLVIDIAKKFEQKVSTMVLPGITYTNWQKAQSDGPVAIQILDISPESGYELRPILAQNQLKGLETIRNMAERYQAPIAVNGGYFGKNGEIYGLLKLDGKLVSVPYQPRTALGITPSGRLIMDQVNYEGWIKLPDGRMVAINGVNTPRSADALTVYNSYYGDKTEGNSQALDLVVTNGIIQSIQAGGATILPGSLVLSAHGQAKKALSTLKNGDKIQIRQTLGQVFDACKYALGAGPRLVKNGMISLTITEEQFGSDVAGGRAPRTAVGRTKKGHILLVVVDGRSLASQGMTLEELAQLMKSLGAWDAMNLDGGGSSEMVLSGKIVNQPSDGRERPVGSALLVLPHF